MKVFFLDNTDPDGYDLVFDKLDGKLGRTLAIVTSKSGGTPEPRNAMVEAQARWEKAGLDFARHAVVTTGTGSKLYNYAKEGDSLNFSRCGIGSGAARANLPLSAFCRQPSKA